ncbi:MAG: choice-of-anchor X domain-containing protein [Methanobacteriota archaeon]
MVAVQESGTPVLFSAKVRSIGAHLPNFTVALALSDPFGASRNVALSADGPWWNGSVPFDLSGTHQYRFVARDADGNTNETGAARLRIVPAAPPSILATGPSGWSNGTPVIRATARELNPDLAATRLTVTFPDRTIDAPVTQRKTPGEVEVVSDTTRFPDGVAVTARLFLRDAGGREATATISFTVDDRPPATDVSGGILRPARGPAYARSTAPIAVSARDAGIGVDRVLASLAPATADPATSARAVGPTFRIADLPGFSGPGNYTLRVFAIDRVGNAETPVRFDLVVEAEAPRIRLVSISDLLRLRVFESGSGVASVRAEVAVEGAPSRVLSLAPVPGDPGLFEARMPSVREGDEVRLVAVAEDRAGNVGLLGAPDAPLVHIVGNHRPFVTIVTPAPRAVLSGPVAVTWSASDLDGDPVFVRLETRPRVVPTWDPLFDGGLAEGSFLWDTARALNGLYGLRAVASDRATEGEADIEVRIENPGRNASAVASPGPLARGEPAVVTVVSHASVAEMTVALSRGSDAVRVPLADDGAPPDERAGDGVYTGTFEPPRTGTWAAEVEILHTGGEREVVSEAGTLRVEGGVVDDLASNPVVVVLAVLFVLVAGVFYFLRLRDVW